MNIIAPHHEGVFAVFFALTHPVLGPRIIVNAHGLPEETAHRLAITAVVLVAPIDSENVSVWWPPYRMMIPSHF